MVTYSVQEAAKILGIRKETMYELVGNGSVGSFKIGRGTKIPEWELRRYIDELVQGK